MFKQLCAFLSKVAMGWTLKQKKTSHREYKHDQVIHYLIIYQMELDRESEITFSKNIPEIYLTFGRCI